MTDRNRPSITRQLFRLAAPIIGINVLNVMTLFVDTAMCGRLPDSEVALAALGFAVQIVFLLLVAMMGLTVSTVALIARAHGAHQPDRIRHVFEQSTLFTILLSGAIAILGNLLAPTILTALGASPAATEAGLDYLRPLLSGTVFYYLTILYGAVMRGVGNTRVPFFCALAANACNIFLNYLLILGNLGFPALGIQGAAIGTVCSQAINITLLSLSIHRGLIPPLALPRRIARIDWRVIGELYRIGVPAALDMIILNAGFLAIVGMIGRIDEIAVAAHGIGLRIQAIAFVPGLGVSQATGAMIGQALGAGAVDRARAITRSSLLLSSAIMTTLAVVFLVAAYPIVAIFDVTAGTPLESYSVDWIRILGYGMLPVGVHIALVGVLQGAGATNTSLRINAFATLLIQIPLGAVLAFPFELGVIGVWLSLPLSFLVKATLSGTAYRRGAWARTGARLDSGRGNGR